MNVIKSVPLSEIDQYTTNALVNIIVTFSITRKECRMKDQLWSAFYELELMRIQVGLPPLDFGSRHDLKRLYDVMLREARHFVIYGNKTLIRDSTSNVISVPIKPPKKTKAKKKK